MLGWFDGCAAIVRCFQSNEHKGIVRNSTLVETASRREG